MKAKPVFIIVAILILGFSFWMGLFSVSIRKNGSSDTSVVLKIDKRSEVYGWITHLGRKTSEGYQLVAEEIRFRAGESWLAEHYRKNPTLYVVVTSYSVVLIGVCCSVVSFIKRDPRFD